MYELILILPVSSKESEAKKLVSDLVEKVGGEVEAVDFWGERRLAYEINDENRGVYILCDVKMEGRKVKDLERRISLQENILRSLLVIKE